MCGLDSATIQQMTNRLIIKTSAGKKMLESKREYKSRMSAIGNAHSPDEADGTALCFQVMQKILGVEPGTKWEPPMRTSSTKYDEKLFAARINTGVTVQEHVARPVLPAADFSGNLNDYIRLRKPF